MKPGTSRRAAAAQAGPTLGNGSAKLNARLRLQRQCACGKKSDGADLCGECRGKLQKRATHGGAVRGEVAVAPARTRARINRLRFVNIETPGTDKGRPAAEEVSNYESIVEILAALGLHCCGNDSKKAQDSVKKGLQE